MTARSKLAIIASTLKWQSSGFVEDHWFNCIKFMLNIPVKICRF